MVKKPKRGKSKAKKTSKKSPKKVPARKSARKAARAPVRKRAIRSGAATAVAYLAPDEARKRVRQALRSCMAEHTTHGDFGWDEGPGTWVMENAAWQVVLDCVCEKIGTQSTAPLLKDTIGLSFTKIVGILAAKVD